MRPGDEVLYLDAKAGWVLGKVDASTGHGEKLMLQIKGKKYGVEQVCEAVGHGESPEDLMDLPQLHEGVVFCALRNVYMSGRCCVRLGSDIVVVVNPYTHSLPDGPLYHHKYFKKPPHHHPFSLAHHALKGLRNHGTSSSIIVTGESGAGKTETTKALLSYLSAKSGKDIKKKVLDVLSLLEIVGNAKTARNDNSSRFGKYITLNFDEEHHLRGAQVHTYLLEVSRVVSHSGHDRCFHVFYALLKAPEGVRNQLLGANMRGQDFRCLNPGTTNLVRNVDDEKNYTAITTALNELGVSHTTQLCGFWTVVAAVMHLMNVTFLATKNDSCTIVDEAHVQKVATLLGLPAEGLVKALTTATVQAPGDAVITTSLTVVKAEAVRNGIAKYLYKSLFDWLVGITNATLKPQVGVVQETISLLDLFGFENFPENRFEQLLINYANESVQNHYNTQLFTRMSDACQAQSVSFKIPMHISNAECIELIESRTGILRTLEDQCALSGLKMSDKAYLEKLCSTYVGPQGQRLNAYFSKPRDLDLSFVLTHYAGDVTYNVAGCIEKNKHPVKDTVTAFLLGSSVNGAAAILRSNTSTSTTLLSREFKEELHHLLRTVAGTETLWIRCVKPNSTKQPNQFEGSDVYRQLHCNGIISTVRLLESGPAMIPFTAFISKYACLYPPSGKERVPRDRCIALQHQLPINAADLQVGTVSHVFVSAYGLKKLSKMRELAKKKAAGRLHGVYCGMLARKELFIEYAAREALRLEEARAEQLRKDEAVWEELDAKRRKEEASKARRRHDTMAHAVKRLETLSKVDADRNEYMAKAHKQLSAWSRFVGKHLNDRAAKEATWREKDDQEERIRRKLLAKHTEEHMLRMEEIKQKAVANSEFYEAAKRREEEARRKQAETRKEKLRVQELAARRRQMLKEEEAARKAVSKESKRTQLEVESETRYQRMLRREQHEARAGTQKGSVVQEVSMRQLRCDRAYKQAVKEETDVKWRAQQQIWLRSEIEEAQRYLSGGAQGTASPYASTIHRDINETFGY